jgi:hypothetical protein
MSNTDSDDRPFDPPPIAGGRRNLAEINDTMVRVERARWQRGAFDIEVYSLDNVLLGPPIFYGVALYRHDDAMAAIALAIWGLGTLLWTPWIVLRVDRRQPAGDAARAAALLGYGLLIWLATPVLVFAAPKGTGALWAFPVIFAVGAGAMAAAAWPQTGPASPSSGRAGLLAGGGAAYLIGAAALGGLAYLFARHSGGFGLAVLLLALLVCLAALAGGAALLRAAWRTWRATRTAAF